MISRENLLNIVATEALEHYTPAAPAPPPRGNALALAPPDLARIRTNLSTAPPMSPFVDLVLALVDEIERLRAVVQSRDGVAQTPGVAPMAVGSPCDLFEPYTGTGLCRTCFFPGARHLASDSMR